MFRTTNNCKSKLLFRSAKQLIIVGVLAFFSATITPASAQAADTVGQNNYGGRKVLTRVEPEYPADLKVVGIGGYVHLTITISPAGTVESSQVVGGNPILAQAAVKAVAKWKFTTAASTTSAEVWFHFAQ